MTAFVALVTPDQAFLAVDSLACEARQKTPYNRVTKRHRGLRTAIGIRSPA
jgi:hypothetical protein